MLISAPAGGVLVVCGAPLEGKGPLAARLHDELPNSVKLERRDDLATSTRGADLELLDEARALWLSQRTVEPTIIVCARFGTPLSRRGAADAAKRFGARFMLVEASSSPIRSLRRVSRMFLDARATTERIERYERAKASYKPLDGDERRRLPAITLTKVLADLDRAVLEVATRWCR